MILSQKISPLVICEILGLHVNTLTADNKYFLCNSENFPQPIQMQFIKNKKHFLNFLLYFWDLYPILNILKKKITLIAYTFTKILTANNFFRLMSKKHPFRTSFHSQHVKVSQTLVKCEWQQFYHIISLLWGKLNWKMSLFVMR